MVYGGLIEPLLDLRLVLLICFVRVFFNLFKRLSFPSTQIPFTKSRFQARGQMEEKQFHAQGLKAKSSEGIIYA